MSKHETLHDLHKALEAGDVVENQSFRILASLEMKPGVEEILQSSEAKLYLTGIQRARAKLQAVVDRELAIMFPPTEGESLGDEPDPGAPTPAVETLPDDDELIVEPPDEEDLETQ